MIYGGYLSTTMPIDVFPDLDRPRVVILTECPGLSPEESEALVTQPIEQAVLGANGVVAVRSQSSMGLAVIYIEFELGHGDSSCQSSGAGASGDGDGQLAPEGIQPLLAPPASIMGQIMHVGLVSPDPVPTEGNLTSLGRYKPAGRIVTMRQ
jgi:Cu/Ag efflux pump CusA